MSNTLHIDRPMRLQLASDLHLEHLQRRHPAARLIQPAPEADLLVLAGDIHNGIAAVEAFADWPVPVLLVAGNHEFYEHWWEQTRADLADAAKGTSVTFLDNECVVVGGVRFAGATLWTDFRIGGFAQPTAMQRVERMLNDYALIETQGGLLRAQDTLRDHELSRAWLEGELAKPFEGKTVVITHHGPHPLSIHPRYARNPINAGFVSDLTEVMPGADLWLHGHVHDSFDYRVGRCRVVANPAGYCLNRQVATSEAGFELENRHFEPRLVIEV